MAKKDIMLEQREKIYSSANIQNKQDYLGT